ncbi:MAG: tRNA-binding protein, partial [Flavobacteriales bacterium]
MEKPLTWEEFERVQMHVGLVLEASEFEAARKPAYIVIVDFGAEIGIRKTSAQITDRYHPS